MERQAQNMIKLLEGTVLLAACACFSACSFVPTPFTPPAGSEVQDYLVYCEGAAVGWERSALQKSEDGGRSGWNKYTEIYVSLSWDPGLREYEIEVWDEIQYDEVWSFVSRRVISGESTSYKFEQRQVDIRMNGQITVRDSTADEPTKPLVLEGPRRPLVNSKKAEIALLGGEPGTTIVVDEVDFNRREVVQKSWVFVGDVEVTCPDGQKISGRGIRKGAAPEAPLSIYDQAGRLLYEERSDAVVLVRVSSIPQPFEPEPIPLPEVMPR